MSQSDRAIKKFATQLARLDREVKSWRGAQADFTSVEDDGSIVFNGPDGNAKAIVGGQDDGGNTINVLSGPTPPTPTNFTVTVDHGSLTVHWDGDFEDGAVAPTDWARWTAYAQSGGFVVPDRTTSIGGTDSASGGEVTAGVLKGEWTVTLLAWSQAGKPSAMAEPVTVDVPGYGDIVLAEIDAAETNIKNAREVLLDGQNTLGEKLDAADTALSGLETSLGELDSTTLPALRNDLDAAEGRLSEAEGQITDAFTELGDVFGQLDGIPGQIDSAKDSAISTAADDAFTKAANALADAQAYADGQDAVWLTAAEQAAQDKADAAQAAAEAVAATAQQTADSALAAINAGESMWLDPGFETSFGPVASTDPAVTRSTEFAYQGAYSLKYTTDGDGAWINPGYIYVDVTPGRVYRLSAAIRSDDGLPFKAWTHQYDSTGSLVAGAANHLQLQGVAGEWVLGNIIVTAMEGAAQIRVAPHIPDTGNGTAGDVLYLDNFTLTDITAGYEQYQEALLAAQEAQQTAGEAKAIAESAVSAAEGGNTNFYSTSDPSGVGALVGDLWYKVDALGGTNGLWHWDGTNWVKQTFNNEVFGDISANKITFGTMHGDRIEAGSLTIGATAGLGDELDAKETPAQAQAKADAAKAAAIAEAEADATAKANSAKSEAVSTAASDATTKANQAATSAVSAAATNAQTQYGDTKALVSGWKRAGTTQIDGGTIATGTVYADAIVSGLSQNMVPDPGFSNAEITANRLARTNNFGAVWSVSNGSVFCDMASITNTPNFPLVSGDDNYAWAAYPSMNVALRVSGRMVSGSGGVRWTIRFKRRNGSTALVVADPSSFTALGSGWTEVSAKYSLPADVVGFTAVMQMDSASVGVAELTAPFVASSVGTTVIEQGAITTGKLAADVLEVGNLKAGTAAIAEAVVAKIAAQTASIQQADVKNLFVTGTSSLSNVVAERIAAETAKFIELEVGNLVAGTGTMDTATINKLFADVVVASMAQAEQFIGENAILTDSITAPKIVASEELWAKIAEFVKIRAEHIEADAIDGMVITGATIRSAATGSRVQLSASGIESYNDANERTFYAEASSGNVYMVGSFYSNDVGQPRVEIDNDDWADIGVPDENGDTHYTNGSGIRIGSNASAGFSIYHGSYAPPEDPDAIEGQAAVIEGPLGKTHVALLGYGDAYIGAQRTDGAKAGRLYAFGNGDAAGYGYDSAGVRRSRIHAGQNGAAELTSYSSDGSVSTFVQAGTDHAGIQTMDAAGVASTVMRGYTNGNVDIQASGSVNVGVSYGAGGRFRVNSVWGVTSSSGSIVRVNSDGTLYRDGSSERYKQDIADAPVVADILNITPRVWRERSAVESSERLAEFRETVEIGPVPRELGDAMQAVPWHFGAVAEELHSLGLTQFVQYDEYHRPDGIDYDRIGVALIPIVRDLRDRITELERQLDE